MYVYYPPCIQARYRSSVVGAGNQFASIRLSSRYSLPGLISEREGGITYMQRLDELIETAEKDWPAMQVSLGGAAVGR